MDLAKSGNIITVVITAVIVFYLAANLFPSMAHALNNFTNPDSNSSSTADAPPLYFLFTPSGIIGLVFVLALLFGAYKLFWSKN